MPPHEREGARGSAVKPPGLPTMPGGAFAHHAPALGAADPFYVAFTASTALTREARRLADVEYRFTMRYRIWETSGEDAPWRAQARRLDDRRQAAIVRAEFAQDRLNCLWADASNRLCRIGHVHGQRSFFTASRRRLAA
jgi:hypothetical protein